MTAAKLPFIVLVCPSCVTVEDAISWFAARGAQRLVLWRGADGLIRGVGRIPVTT